MNLDLYTDAIRGLSSEELRGFNAYLIGWLLTDADPETVREALDAAANDAAAVARLAARQRRQRRVTQ